MSKIVLLGDSIMANMPRSFIGSFTDCVVNKALANVGVENYRKFCFPKLDNRNVDVYVVSMGIDNIINPSCDSNKDKSMDSLVRNLENFIDDISKNGNAKLIVEGIFPTCYEYINEDINYVNEKLCKYCLNRNIEYLDLCDILSDDKGLLRKEYSSDGVQLNVIAYNLISKKVNRRISLLNNKTR